MSTQTQTRRGTAAQIAAMTPAEGEVVNNLTDDRLHVGDGTRPGGWPLPNFSDCQKQAFGYATAGGTGDAITLTLAPALLAYTGGVAVEFLATADNTGAVTVNINGLGTKNIYKLADGVLGALEAGDIQSGGVYRITYDGTQFQIIGLSQSGSKGWELLAVASGGGTSYDFTSDITNEFGVYAFLLRNLTPATSSALRMRISRSGVSGFDSDANYTSVSSLTQVGMTVSREQAATSLRVVPNVLSLAALATSFGVHGLIMAYNIGNSGRAQFVGDLMADADYVTRVAFGGNHATGTAIDGVQFYFQSGNIDSGDIFMYGVNTQL